MRKALCKKDWETNLEVICDGALGFKPIKIREGERRANAKWS